MDTDGLSGGTGCPQSKGVACQNEGTISPPPMRCQRKGDFKSSPISDGTHIEGFAQHENFPFSDLCIVIFLISFLLFFDSILVF